MGGDAGGESAGGDSGTGTGAFGGPGDSGYGATSAGDYADAYSAAVNSDPAFGIGYPSVGGGGVGGGSFGGADAASAGYSDPAAAVYGMTQAAEQAAVNDPWGAAYNSAYNAALSGENPYSAFAAANPVDFSPNTDMSQYAPANPDSYVGFDNAPVGTQGAFASPTGITAAVSPGEMAANLGLSDFSFSPAENPGVSPGVNAASQTAVGIGITGEDSFPGVWGPSPGASPTAGTPGTPGGSPGGGQVGGGGVGGFSGDGGFSGMSSGSGFPVFDMNMYAQQTPQAPPPDFFPGVSQISMGPGGQLSDLGGMNQGMPGGMPSFLDLNGLDPRLLAQLMGGR